MLARIIRFFWPDLSVDETKKYGILSVAFFFIIGTYWLLRPLKDGFFFSVVGGKYQPAAKMISVFIVGFLVIVYSKLVDMVEKHKLFYILGSIYTVLFASVAFVIGLPRTGESAINPEILRFFGWASYFIIESFGSIVVALFWSFVASISDAKAAKKGYSLIIVGAQIGAIVGPFVATNAESVGMRLLFSIGTLAIVAMMFTIRYFIKVMPKEQLEVNKQEVKSEEKAKTGFMEGLKLLLTRPYLVGILAVATIYEIVGTIVDYQMKVQAKALPQYASEESFTAFMGVFGMSANSLAFVMALLGTGYLMRKMGLRFCLLTFPIVLGSAMAILYGVYAFGNVNASTMLWLTFAVMMIAKGLSYALNNPSKEMMYIPTSKDAKFKSKGWIDMFGGRVSKALGASFTNFLKASPHALMAYGTILSLGFIGVWIVAAFFVSNKFEQLTKDGKIVE
ncbi:MFS transporter [Candidatus Dependentiae bacterium]|nr:MFS transporter [Candidatus Dependentiae bacterium]MBU4387766.1 MFS transporter [Candidatus Dependentiae bacterium]MCG2755947.1 MFS transporter [Candidatus Dependentiae bacterium]